MPPKRKSLSKGIIEDSDDEFNSASHAPEPYDAMLFNRLEAQTCQRVVVS